METETKRQILQVHSVLAGCTQRTREMMLLLSVSRTYRLQPVDPSEESASIYNG